MTHEELTALATQAWTLAEREPARAHALASRAVAEASGESFAGERGEALRALGAAEIHLGRHRDARPPLAEAARLLRERPERAVALAQAELLLLRSHFLDGEPEGALRHGRLALDTARAAGAAAEEARALNDLGLVYAHLGAYEPALEHLLEALRRHEGEGPPAGGPLNNLGNLYLLHEEPGRAAEFFERARRAYRAAGNAAGEITALGNLGRAHAAQEDLAAARRFHEDAVGLARAVENPAPLAPALTKLGSVLARLGEEAGARTAFREALAVFDRHPGAFRNETLVALAELHVRQGEPDEAIRLLEAVLGHARAAGDRELEAQAYQGLASALETGGRWRDALEHHKRATGLQRELERERHSSRSRALLLHHELEQAERERELLQAKNEALQEAYGRLREMNARLERQTEELERLSLEDPLTGLHNRRALERTLAKELARRKRHGETFSVAMLDIDAFKGINDRHSHLVGDEILYRVGMVLRRGTREMDVAARVGGEEFVVLFPTTPLPAALAAAENLRTAVEGHPWGEVRAELRVTVSLGVAEARAGQSAAEILAEADRQLYRAKVAGKNRVCSAADEERDGRAAS